MGFATDVPPIGDGFPVTEAIAKSRETVTGETGFFFTEVICTAGTIGDWLLVTVARGLGCGGAEKVVARGACT